MPRWKDSRNLIGVQHDGEVFDPNWMNHEHVQEPPTFLWSEKRPPRFEEIDIWEVITEWGGLGGVYAAWCPYAEYYVVMQKWRMVAEFSGWNANGRLEKYLQENNIPYPHAPDTIVQPHVALATYLY